MRAHTHTSAVVMQLFTHQRGGAATLQLDKLWSWASSSVAGLPVAKALPVFQAKSQHSAAYVKFNKFRRIYVALTLK